MPTVIREFARASAGEVGVIAAGVFGAVTAKASILFTQGLPAALALGAVCASKRDLELRS